MKSAAPVRKRQRHSEVKELPRDRRLSQQNRAQPHPYGLRNASTADATSADPTTWCNWGDVKFLWIDSTKFPSTKVESTSSIAPSIVDPPLPVLRPEALIFDIDSSMSDESTTSLPSAAHKKTLSPKSVDAPTESLIDSKSGNQVERTSEGEPDESNSVNLNNGVARDVPSGEEEQHKHHRLQSIHYRPLKPSARNSDGAMRAEDLTRLSSSQIISDGIAIGRDKKKMNDKVKGNKLMMWK